MEFYNDQMQLDDTGRWCLRRPMIKILEKQNEIIADQDKIMKRMRQTIVNMSEEKPKTWSVFLTTFKMGFINIMDNSKTLKEKIKKLARQNADLHYKLCSSRNKNTMYDKKIEIRDAWITFGYQLINEQLQMVEKLQHGTVDATELINHKNHIRGFIADYQNFLAEDERIDINNVSLISRQKALELATNIIERTNPAAPRPSSDLCRVIDFPNK